MATMSSFLASAATSTPTIVATLVTAAPLATTKPTSPPYKSHSINWPSILSTVPTSTSSPKSSSATSFHITPWAIVLISMAVAAILVFSCVASVAHTQHKQMKKEYAEALEREPGLGWGEFQERWKQKLKERLADEEAGELADGERFRNRSAEAKTKKLRGKERLARGDEDGLLSAGEGRVDEVLPPPYFSVMDPASEVGMKPWS